MKVEIVKKANFNEKLIAHEICGSVIEDVEEAIIDFLMYEEDINIEFATEAVANMKPSEMADIIKYILTEYKTQNGLTD